MTDREFEERFPLIAWREPIVVDLLEGTSRDPERAFYGCRFCIARFGLRGEAIPRLPQSRAEFEAHMAAVHGS